MNYYQINFLALHTRLVHVLKLLYHVVILQPFFDFGSNLFYSQAALVDNFMFKNHYVILICLILKATLISLVLKLAIAYLHVTEFLAYQHTVLSCLSTNTQSFHTSYFRYKCTCLHTAHFKSLCNFSAVIIDQREPERTPYQREFC